MNHSKRITRESEHEVPLNTLIDHLLVEYHRPLGETMPRISALAKRVLEVHGANAPQDLAGIHETFAALRSELERHMMKEERVLFPLIRNGRGASADNPVQVMLHEHRDAIGAIKTLRRLTNDYVAPTDACTTWKNLWSELQDFETDLFEHIRLENDVLFPRALAGPLQA